MTRRPAVVRRLVGHAVVVLVLGTAVASSPSATLADDRDAAARSPWAGGPAGDHATMVVRSDTRPPDVVHSYLPGESLVRASWEDGETGRRLRLSMRSDTAGMDLLLTPPAGEDVQQRTYSNLGANGDSGTNGDLEVRAEDLGCLATADGSQASVELLRLSDDLSEVWARVDVTCLATRGRIWGEVRIGAPAPDGPRLAASTVVWPVDHAGHDGVVVPVTVTPTGTDRDIDVELADDQHFRLVRSTCGPVRAGDPCRVLVAFRPTGPGVKRTELRVRDTSGTSVVPLRGTARPGLTRWQVDDGRARRTQTPDDSDIVVIGNRRRISWSVDDEEYLGAATGAFSVPAGMEEGRTYAVSGEWGPGLVTLRLGGNGGLDGVLRPRGNVTVDHADFGPEGELRSLALTYRVGVPSSGIGASLSLGAPRAVAAPPVPPPTERPEISRMQPQPRVGGVDVEWDPSDRTTPLTAVLRVGPRAGGPQPVVYRGPRTMIPVNGLLPGRDVRLTLELRDRWGNVSRPRTMSMHGSRLSLVAGAGGRVRGRLLDSGGRGVPEQRVTVTTTGPGGAVASTQHTTGPNGGFSTPVVPAGAAVVASYGGTPYFLSQDGRRYLGSSAHLAVGGAP